MLSCPQRRRWCHAYTSGGALALAPPLTWCPPAALALKSFFILRSFSFWYAILDAMAARAAIAMVPK